MSKVKTYGKRMPKNEACPLGTPSPRHARRRKPEVEPVRASKPEFPIPTFVPTAAYVATKPSVKKDLVTTQEVVDAVAPPAVESLQMMDQPISIDPVPAAEPATPRSSMMTLTLKGLSKNGKEAVYTGAVQPVRFKVANFAGKVAPETVEVDDVLLPAKVKAAKIVETKEERKVRLAAMPKPTLAERARKAQERADKLAKKAAEADSL